MSPMEEKALREEMANRTANGRPVAWSTVKALFAALDEAKAKTVALEKQWQEGLAKCTERIEELERQRDQAIIDKETLLQSFVEEGVI